MAENIKNTGTDVTEDDVKTAVTTIHDFVKKVIDAATEPTAVKPFPITNAATGKKLCCWVVTSKIDIDNLLSRYLFAEEFTIDFANDVEGYIDANTDAEHPYRFQKYGDKDSCAAEPDSLIWDFVNAIDRNTNEFRRHIEIGDRIVFDESKTSMAELCEKCDGKDQCEHVHTTTKDSIIVLKVVGRVNHNNVVLYTNVE